MTSERSLPIHHSLETESASKRSNAASAFLHQSAFSSENKGKFDHHQRSFFN